MADFKNLPDDKPNIKAKNLYLIQMKYSIVALLLFALVGCQDNRQSITAQTDSLFKASNLSTQKKGDLPDPLNYDVKNTEYVNIKHGNSAMLNLFYGGPEVLVEMDFMRLGKESFHLGFGQNDVSHPAFLKISDQKDSATITYHFDGSSGEVWRIAHHKYNNYDGPYYMFHPHGELWVSGFYKKNDYSGIWRLYDKKGNILQTVNADVVKYDILKLFKVEE